MFSLFFWYGGWGIVLPRIFLGLLLLVHGWPKIKNLKQNAKNFHGMGFKPGILWGTIAALVEFVGGIFLILALWPAWISFLIMGEFVVIIFWSIGKNRPFVGGWELDLMILALATLFFTMYGGAFLVASGSF